MVDDDWEQVPVPGMPNRTVWWPKSAPPPERCTDAALSEVVGRWRDDEHERGRLSRARDVALDEMRWLEPIVRVRCQRGCRDGARPLGAVYATSVGRLFFAVLRSAIEANALVEKAERLKRAQLKEHFPGRWPS